MTLFVVTPFLLALPGLVKDWRVKLAEAPNFQAVLNNGAFTIAGVPQPLVIKGLGENFIVALDTASTTTSTVDSYLDSSAQSGLLVTNEKVELYNGVTGEQKTQNWKGTPDFSINKTKLNELVGKYLNFSWLAAGSVLFFLLVFIGNVIVRLMALLSVVVIVFILAKFARQSWKFKELFTIGLFAITLPLLLEALLGALSGAMIPIFFLALLAFMLALVFTKNDGAVKKDETKQV